MNLPLLRTELDHEQYSALSNAEAADLLNAPTIPYTVEVPTPELTNFLMNTGLYAKLLAVYRDHPVLQVRVVAEGALDLAQSQIASVNVNNPVIQATLPALVQGGVWTQAEADSVLNFARRLKSRAQQLLGEPLTESDIGHARNLDAIAHVQTLLESAGTAYGEVLALLQNAKRDLEAGLPLEAPKLADVTARFALAMQSAQTESNS